MKNTLVAFRFYILLALAGMLAAGNPCEADGQYFRYGKNKVQYESHEWFFLQSEHFDVYYYEGGYHLADFAAKAAESAYRQLTDLLQYQIAERIPFIVYQSHNDFVVTNAVDLPIYSEGIGGVTELFKNRIALPFTGDYRDFRRVVHHELVHAVLNDMFYGGSIQSIIQNNIRLVLPLWFNEGLAEYAALGWDTQSDMYVREAVLEDDLAPIRRLNGYFAYRGGQSVWDYIVEQYGREKVAEILQRIRVSRSVEAGFKQATGLSLDELSERWHRSLKEIHYPELAAREDLDAFARPIITREKGFYYNAGPALSPQGDRVAFVTNRGALFDVYIADAADGKIIKKLVDGQDSRRFESLRILTPGLSWSPDGRSIAMAVKSGPSDAIALVDVRSRRTRHYRLPGIDQINTVAWSPTGDRIAFEGSRDAQSDIFVLDLDTRTAVNYTNDVFSDHEPSWSPDGRSIVFHSDRGAHTLLHRYAPADLDMFEHDYRQMDVYLLEPGRPEVRRLTSDALWDDEHARFAGPERVLFISDRNGIPNLYEKNLATGAERPLSDVEIGVTQLSLSADGSRAALVSLKDGTPSIFVLNAPASRSTDREVLLPNVWAQRAARYTSGEAPAVSLARDALRQGNPFMRDAVDGEAYAGKRDRPDGSLASRSSLLSAILDGSRKLAPDGKIAAREENAASEADSTTYGGVRIDLRSYVFSDEAPSARSLSDGFLSPQDNTTPDGRYKPRKYKLTFSPDLVYGTAGYDALYGVQGVTQMMFSDMLGNHQIFVATNLLIDLRNSDYILAYNYLPHRVDWSISGFHMSRLLPDYDRYTYFRYRQYGAGIAMSYPFDKFRRVEVDVSALGVSQADISDPTVPQVTRSLLYPSVTYTSDVSTPGMLYPIGGRRFAVSLSGSPGNVTGKQIRFLTVLSDWRAYTSFGRGRYSLALRASGGASVGPDRQLFYTSGVQNWINRRFDPENGFPITDISDFIFATPVMPLRGADINALNGSYFGLVNAEFRFPLVAALLPGPIPILPLYNLQGTAFVDAGSLWGGRGADKRFNVFHRDEAGRRSFDDLLVGSGAGLRTLLLGYLVRIDFAWPFDGRRFGHRKIYFSIGLDF